MLVQRAVPAALRTRLGKPSVTRQPHMQLAIAQLQVDALNSPWLPNTRHLGVQVSVLRLTAIRNRLDCPRSLIVR